MPLQLIWGDDSAAIDNEIEGLVNKIIEPAWKCINLTKLDGSDLTQASNALKEARTPPFGSGGRLIFLANSPFCNGCNTELAKELESSIEVIPKTSFLVLINKARPDGRLKTTKKIQALIKDKLAKEKSFLLPTAWDVSGQRERVKKTAQEFGLVLDQEAIEALVDSIGPDTVRLRNEMEKLSINSEIKQDEKNSGSAPQAISSKVVNALIAGITTNFFKVGDALLNQDIGEAIAQLDNLIDAGEPSLRIIASLSSQIRGWLWISLLEREGVKDVSQIAKAAGIANPKRIYILRKQINGKQPKIFLKMLTQLLEIEADLKNGKHPYQAFRDGLIKTL